MKQCKTGNKADLVAVADECGDGEADLAEDLGQIRGADEHGQGADSQLVNAGVEQQEEEEGAVEAEAEGDLNGEEGGEWNHLHFIDDAHVC